MKQPASAVTGAAEMQTAPSSAQGGRRRGRRYRSDMYDTIRCAQLLVVGTGSQHARRACAGFDLVWFDLIWLDSTRSRFAPFLDATIWSVRAAANASCWRYLFAELRKSTDTGNPADGDALSQPLPVTCVRTSIAGVSSNGSASPASMAQPAASRTVAKMGRGNGEIMHEQDGA